jgi:hypothetical protein
VRGAGGAAREGRARSACSRGALPCAACCRALPAAARRAASRRPQKPRRAARGMRAPRPAARTRGVLLRLLELAGHVRHAAARAHGGWGRRAAPRRAAAASRRGGAPRARRRARCVWLVRAARCTPTPHCPGTAWRPQRRGAPCRPSAGRTRAGEGRGAPCRGPWRAWVEAVGRAAVVGAVPRVQLDLPATTIAPPGPGVAGLRGARRSRGNGGVGGERSGGGNRRGEIKPATRRALCRAPAAGPANRRPRNAHHGRRRVGARVTILQGAACFALARAGGPRGGGRAPAARRAVRAAASSAEAGRGRAGGPVAASGGGSVPGAAPARGAASEHAHPDHKAHQEA